jgi:hypothetical protein
VVAQSPSTLTYLQEAGRREVPEAAAPCGRLQ